MMEQESSQNLLSNILEDKQPPILFLLLLSGMGIVAYFTVAKLVTSVGNNIGPFEAMAMALFILAFIYFLRTRRRVTIHFTVKILFLIVVVAVVSLPNLADRILWGSIQLGLLVYTAVLVLVLSNVIIQHPSLIRYLLRFITIGALIAGVWIIYEGILYQAPIGTAGPFRNRSHVGIYMLSSFWLVLLYFFWPGTSKHERILAIGVIFVVLYGVAVSGRRSVYLSLFIGIALLGLSFLFTKGQDKFKLSTSVLVAAGMLFVLAQIGSQFIPQLGFFNDRIGLIVDRLELAVGTGDEIEVSDNFIVLQRQGMFAAVADHPILGIGWGGFFESDYSPTGHEMHSTPQRFLAELGLVGFSLYLIFNIYIWVESVRLFFRLRETPFQLPALVFAVSMLSLGISWAYNRSVTERTYWLLIILFISFDTLVKFQFSKFKKSAVRKRSPSPGYRYPQPESQHAPPLFPYSQD
jgi:hypothetical protein